MTGPSGVICVIMMVRERTFCRRINLTIVYGRSLSRKKNGVIKVLKRYKKDIDTYAFIKYTYSPLRLYFKGMQNQVFDNRNSPHY